MATNYDDLYRETPHALGAANGQVTGFFEARPRPLDVLDVGCGQGRDALPLARAGHRVHGIDVSPAGIAQMLDEAAAEGLPLTGEVADLMDYAPDRDVDVVLVDRTLHMIAGESDRLAILKRLIAVIRPGGWLLLLDEISNMPAFAALLGADDRAWRAEFQGTIRDADRPVTGTLFAQAQD